MGRVEFTNIGKEPGRLLVAFYPAGLEEFFLSVSVPVKSSMERPHVDVAALMARVGEGAERAGLIKTGETKYSWS